jgi:transposase-like zinc-binding protein
VRREFQEYLKCGRLEHGNLRVVCEACHAEELVAFSCKRRGFCPSCGARRMVESPAHLVDEVLPKVPLRQWVLSVPLALRYLFARDPKALRSALEEHVPGWHHARDVRAAGFPLPPGRPNAGSPSEPHTLSRGLRSPPSLARTDRAGAQRLKRVFAIEIEKCEGCGGRVRIITSIEDPQVIERILEHLGLQESPASEAWPRGPPRNPRLFDCDPPRSEPPRCHRQGGRRHRRASSSDTALS